MRPSSCQTVRKRSQSPASRQTAQFSISSRIAWGSPSISPPNDISITRVWQWPAEASQPAGALLAASPHTPAGLLAEEVLRSRTDADVERLRELRGEMESRLGIPSLGLEEPRDRAQPPVGRERREVDARHGGRALGVEHPPGKADAVVVGVRPGR